MADSELLRVSKIRVVNLFGRYTHEIELRAAERVTILHGPNGIGKTVLLRMLAGALSGNYRELMIVPFESFEIAMSDGQILSFSKALGSDRPSASLTKPNGERVDLGVSAPHPRHPGIQESPKMADLHHRVSVYFIEAHRLWGRPAGKTMDSNYSPESLAVHECAKDLKERMAAALASYAEESQRLDQTFPQRLLRAGVKPLTQGELAERMRRLDERRA